jgi:GDP-D-mannose 3',5'-epimerase
VQKKIIVLGAAGFIGWHLVKKLKAEGNYTLGVDLKYPEYEDSYADEFLLGDLRDINFVRNIIFEYCDEVYQLAADMGGAGYVFSGSNDAEILTNSALINLNVAKVSTERKVKKVFFASSACVYPEFNQLDPQNPICTENTAYPAMPDSNYGWEKLYSERLYRAYSENYGLNVKIARLHNVYGTYCAYNNGREKAPAAICRKLSAIKSGDSIEIWGDGTQTRTFLHINDCMDAILLLMKSEYHGPLNIGSEELISINDLVNLVSNIANKEVRVSSIDGPVGVKGRKSDNTLIKHHLGWSPKISLIEGMSELYFWLEKQMNEKN